MQKKTFEEIKTKLDEITDTDIDTVAYEAVSLCEDFDTDNSENPFFGKVIEIR